MGAAAVKSVGDSLHDSFAACRAPRASITPFPHRFRAARKESLGKEAGDDDDIRSSAAKAVADGVRLQAAARAAVESGNDEFRTSSIEC